MEGQKWGTKGSVCRRQTDTGWKRTLSVPGLPDGAAASVYSHIKSCGLTARRKPQVCHLYPPRLIVTVINIQLMFLTINTNLIWSWEWLEDRISANNDDKISPASLWYYPYPPADLDDLIINFSSKIAKLVSRKKWPNVDTSGYCSKISFAVYIRWQNRWVICRTYEMCNNMLELPPHECILIRAQRVSWTLCVPVDGLHFPVFSCALSPQPASAASC